MVTQPELIRPAELVAADSDVSGRGNDTWEVLTAARDGDVARLGVLLDRNRTLANAHRLPGTSTKAISTRLPRCSTPGPR